MKLIVEFELHYGLALGFFISRTTDQFVLLIGPLQITLDKG